MTFKASNGHSTGPHSDAPDAVPLPPPAPVPAEFLAHCVALLPSAGEQLVRFSRATRARLPNLAELDERCWALVDRPRPCTYARVTGEGYSWHLLYDPDGLPEGMRNALLETGGEELESRLDGHRASAMIFLLEAPAEAGPLERFRALCRMAWAWLDAGAELLWWPEGRVAHPAQALAELDPAHLLPEQTHLFLSHGMALRQGDRVWLRTWGMAQFGLPDLTAGLTVPTSSGGTEADPAWRIELESLKSVFESLPTAMVRERGVLPTGGQVQAGDRIWTAVQAEGNPGMLSRFGFQQLA